MSGDAAAWTRRADGVSARLRHPGDTATASVDRRLAAAATGPSFLFLQGPPSPFARELGAHLVSRGARVRRVNFCIGDWIWWHDRRAISYRGNLERWEAYLEALIRRDGVTDIVYFADRVPYHRVAARVAARLGVRAISYEYGYLRPDWITVEPGGQSAWSRFPDCIGRIRALADGAPAPDLAPRYRKGGFAESAGDAVYYLSNYLLWFLYPRFQRDRIYSPLREYLNYPLRFLRARLARRRAAVLTRALAEPGRRFFLVPLQMQNDYQIRANSPWTDQREFLEEVIGSFAGAAAPGDDLVIKMHPLDNGLEDWCGFIADAAVRHEVSRRVHFLDGGDLARLTALATGMVIINSTCGMAALHGGCPLKVMGVATFDLDGLTHQGPLDGFWQAPLLPSREDVDALIALTAARAQVRGNFYDPDGRRAAVEVMAERLLAADWDEVFEALPPRLGKARAMGIDVAD